MSHIDASNKTNTCLLHSYLNCIYKKLSTKSRQDYLSPQTLKLLLLIWYIDAFYTSSKLTWVTHYD